MVMLLPDTREMCNSSACPRRPTGSGGSDYRVAVQSAVATRQKSTARRLVSICAVLEDTHQMLFTRGLAVTLTGGLAQNSADRREHVGLARPARRASRDRTVRGEHQDRRGAEHPEPPGQVKPLRGVRS